MSLTKPQILQPNLKKTKPATRLPVTLEQGKSQLGYVDDDQRVQSLIEAATDQAETMADRTIADSVTWQWSVPYFQRVVQFPYAPLLSVESVTYIDADSTTQTINPSNYSISVSTELPGRLEFSSDYVAPSTNDSLLPITFTFQAGYGDVELIPGKLTQLVLLLMSVFDDRDDPKYVESAMQRAEQLAISGSPGLYS